MGSQQVGTLGHLGTHSWRTLIGFLCCLPGRIAAYAVIVIIHRRCSACKWA